MQRTYSYVKHFSFKLVIVSQGLHGGKVKVTWVKGHEGEGQPKGTALMAKLFNLSPPFAWRLTVTLARL